MAPPPQPPPSFPPTVSAVSGASSLLSLPQCEEAILQLLELSATVCSALSEVHEDPVSEVAPAARQFHATLRLVYASLLAHIRAHAGEVHLQGGGVGTGAGGSVGHAGAVTAAASAAREYRRNIYLDSQHVAVLLDSMAIVKARIEDAQAEQAQKLKQTQDDSMQQR
jgi:hypothetical protein